MTRRAILASSLAAVLMAAIGLRAQAPQGQTVFRSATDVVTIDVAVRASGTPVGGLSARDFVLLDNGVRQEIEAIELEAVPVDITILIDASGDMADHIADLTDQARKIAAMARPADRVRVMQFGTYVSDVIRAQPAANLPELAKPRPTGLPSAHDAIVMALLRRVEPGRRHLVIAITNGIDAISTLDAASVRDIARRSSATLEIAQVDVALKECPCPPFYIGGRERLEHARGPALITNQKRPFWRPYDDEQFDVLSEAAESTGGALHLPGVFVDRNASAIFEKVFAEYQRSYVLRYSPQGVARAGWHTVKVTIPKYGSYTVHTRPGYSLEPAASVVGATPAATPAPSDPAARAPLPLSTIDGLKAAYDAANYADVTAALRDADAGRQPATLADSLRTFERGGNPWPANPHREAVFVLELADVALQSRNAAAVQAITRLLPVYAKLVREPLDPAPFERLWFSAALALLEDAHQSALVRTVAGVAAARFPDEPRFAEARDSLGEDVRILGTLRAASPSRDVYASLIEQLRRQTR